MSRLPATPRRFFGDVELVHLTPTSMVEEQRAPVKYEVFYFHGEWKGASAAGCGMYPHLPSPPLTSPHLPSSPLTPLTSS